MDTNLKELKKELKNIIKQQNQLQHQLIKLNKHNSKLLAEISKAEFNFVPTLEKLCELSDLSSLQDKELSNFKKYIKKHHPYIELLGKNLSGDQLLFEISQKTKSYKYVDKIEYLFSLLRYDKFNMKTIQLKGYYNLELCMQDNEIYMPTYGGFDNMQKALDFIYTEIFTYGEINTNEE
jgi:predicted nuclease with TOPRIM domain